jgi:uncharacterized protein YrrD
MQTVNTLFGKPIVSQSTGNQLGSVRDVVLSSDTHRILALVGGGGGWSGKEQVIRWPAISGVGEYVVVNEAGPLPAVGEDAEISELRAKAEKITGKPIVSTQGERLGTVDDLYYNSRGEIVGYAVKQGTFGGTLVLRAGAVQSVGKDAVIASSSELVDANELELQQEAETRAVGANDLGQRPELRDPSEV